MFGGEGRVYLATFEHPINDLIESPVLALRTALTKSVAFAANGSLELVPRITIVRRNVASARSVVYSLSKYLNANSAKMASMHALICAIEARHCVLHVQLHAGCNLFIIKP